VESGNAASRSSNGSYFMAMNLVLGLTSQIRQRRIGRVDDTTDAIRAVACIRFLGPVRLEFLEPSFIYGDVLNHFGVRAEAKLFELVSKLVAVNEVNWRRTVSCGFLDGVA
jgi:hypothetical protein